MTAEPINIKIVVVGDGTVGKTCLLTTYAEDRFPLEYVPTVFENFTTQLSLDKNQFNISLWDTAGQETYEKLRVLSYQSADVFIIVYSVIDPKTLDNVIQKWIPELQQYAVDTPIVIAGNKTDLRNDINKIENYQAILNIINRKHIECSALTQHNVKLLFETAVREYMKVNVLGAKKTNSIYTAPKKKKFRCSLI
ncbi:hypothetical protein pb186bvf_005517 [Paramecium bursaria]